MKLDPEVKQLLGGTSTRKTKLFVRAIGVAEAECVARRLHDLGDSGAYALLRSVFCELEVSKIIEVARIKVVERVAVHSPGDETDPP